MILLLLPSSSHKLLGFTSLIRLASLVHLHWVSLVSSRWSRKSSRPPGRPLISSSLVEVWHSWWPSLRTVLSSRLSSDQWTCRMCFKYEGLRTGFDFSCNFRFQDMPRASSRRIYPVRFLHSLRHFGWTVIFVSQRYFKDNTSLGS